MWPQHVDALNGQTLRDLEVIADREGMITEQVMSQALDWWLTSREQSSG